MVEEGVSMQEIKQAPGPKGWPFLGSLLEMRKNPMTLMMQAALGYGGIAQIKLGPERAFLVSDPDFLKYVYQDHVKNFVKQTKAWRMFRLIFGEGLLTSDGELWRRQRRLMQPSFHREKIAGFTQVMSAATQTMLEAWKAVSPGTPLDISPEMMRLTLQIVGETLLGINMSADSEIVSRALPILLEETSYQVRRLVRLPMAFPSPRHLRFRRALAEMKGVGMRVIQARKAHPEKAADLLEMLMDAKDEENGKSMSTEQLLDEVLTIFVAGHETTANALTWTWYLLSQNPEVEKKFFKEIDEALQGKTPVFEDLPKLQYVERVFKEGLRLYPPAWFVGRLVLEDDEIGGYSIPAGSMVFLSPYVTHHSPRIWKDPERFDPDRFLPENFSKMHRFAYIPFGAGPRQCIGNHFAIMEAQIILASIAQKYRLKLVPGQRIEKDPMITLRPKYGMKMYLENRF